MGFRHQTQQVACCFPPPSVYGAQKVSEPIDTSIKLRIMPREGEKSTLVQEGSRVYLINSYVLANVGLVKIISHVLRKVN